MTEEWGRDTGLISNNSFRINDSVSGRWEFVICQFLEHVTDINDDGPFRGVDRMPIRLSGLDL